MRSPPCSQESWLEPLFKAEAEMSPFLSLFSKGASVDNCELGSDYEDSTWPESNEKSGIAFITPGESLQAAGGKHRLLMEPRMLLE